MRHGRFRRQFLVIAQRCRVAEVVGEPQSRLRWGRIELAGATALLYSSHCRAHAADACYGTLGANNGTTGRGPRVNVTSDVTARQSQRECGRCGVRERAQVRQLSKAENGAIRQVDNNTSQSSGKIAVAQIARIASSTTPKSGAAD